jgi:hypothetical protein
MGNMKRMTGLAVIVMVLAGMGRAEPVRYLAERAEAAGEAGMAAWLSGLGVTNDADQAEMAAAWEEDAVVDVALRRGAYALLGPVMCRHKMSARNRERVREAVLAERPAPAAVLAIVRGYPLAERGVFREACMEAIPASTMGSRPSYARLYVDTVLLGGQWIAKGLGDLNDMVSVLLAGEYLLLREAAECKEGIKAAAVTLAREKLHAEGRSFVMRDGVNPIAERVRPVVEALNAPECAGLEAALRALGRDVPERDRGDLRRVAEEWRGDIVRGEAGAALHLMLGRLSVALGPEAYNRFVDVYNNGAGGVR